MVRVRRKGGEKIVLMVRVRRKGGEKIVLMVRVTQKRELADNSRGDTKGRDSLYVEQNSVYHPSQLRILEHSNVNATRCEWLRSRHSNFTLSFVK
jgi:CRISPR/Cas system-associated endonuclease/helicase Cas3